MNLNKEILMHDLSFDKGKITKIRFKGVKTWLRDSLSPVNSTVANEDPLLSPLTLLLLLDLSLF